MSSGTHCSCAGYNAVSKTALSHLSGITASVTKIQMDQIAEHDLAAYVVLAMPCYDPQLHRLVLALFSAQHGSCLYRGVRCRYEGVRAAHSWNANWLFTNSCMFQLPLHSDHHMHGAKPYQALQDKREAPQLPASYSVMALLAMVPIAFFTVMNPRAIAAQQAHDIHQA